MRLLSTLESKFGRFAIPGLVQTIALFQLLILCISMMMTREAAEVYLEYLDLDPTRILHGEVWRLVTHILIPRNFSLIGLLFGTLLMMMMGGALEQAWGAFRLNLYILGWMLAAIVGAFVFHWSIPGLFLYQSILFAFAVLDPDYEIQIYFILPVKMKWVAALSAGMTAFLVIGTPALIVPVILGHLNFLVAFGPGFLSERARMAQVASRRSRFESAQLPQGTFFHQCSVCKKTELDDPTLDFRVLDSGDEICTVCRAKQAAG